MGLSSRLGGDWIGVLAVLEDIGRSEGKGGEVGKGRRVVGSLGEGKCVKIFFLQITYSNG